MDAVLAANTVQKTVDAVGQKVQKLFGIFLEEFIVDGEQKYVKPAEALINLEHNTLTVSFVDVEVYNQHLATSIQEEYYRFYPFLCRAVKYFAREHYEEIPQNKELYLALKDIATKHKIRELRNTRVGSLMCISGQVVRTHPVHPELVLGTFTCLDCQTVIKGVEQQFKYMQPTICRNPQCGNRRKFLLDPNKSSFVDFQKVRIQETQSDLPRGSVPRTIDIILRAEAVESAQAGDRCDFIGTLIVVPDVSQLLSATAQVQGSRNRKQDQAPADGVQGLKALGVRELTYKQAFLACHVTTTNPTFGGKEISANETMLEAIKNQMTEREWEKVYSMSCDKNLYSNLCNSLFPTIHGSEEIKRGILLQLFGGVPKTTEEGTTLRGDLNVCIVGDPSTGKSQFLKKVEEFSARAVYTSGKASSAAGLTAAVVRDEETNEFVIEAGALMLADNGICCIDEFDKMEVKDQVAIHEAMEQQTISIAKAGVKATLNARTSILAAANPIGGRYDRTKSLRKNIQLSAPIMSRFDLFFILVDECNEVTDYAIARRIVDLHTRLDHSINRIYTLEEAQRYLMFARMLKPKISKEAGEFMVQEYRHMRERDSCGVARSSWRITVRQLESLIRLSEAMARMYCLDEVLPKHVKEAARLLNKSIIRVETPDINFLEEESTIPEDTEAPAPPAEEEAAMQTAEEAVATPPEKVPQKMRYEEYLRLCNMLVYYMRKKEEEEESMEYSEDSETGEGGGMRKSQLVNWYLEQISDDVESEEELLQYKSTIEKVIFRLTHQDKVFIELSNVELEASEKTESQERDVILVVHPDYVVD